MKHLLYTLLLGVFLTSCYRKIDLDEYRTTPKMVINSVVSPDTVVMASITRTWFYPDKKEALCQSPSRPCGALYQQSIHRNHAMENTE